MQHMWGGGGGDDSTYHIVPVTIIMAAGGSRPHRARHAWGRERRRLPLRPQN